MNRINLFSKEWCELVFAGKNRIYGAYRIRMESNVRHIKAMGVVFLVVVLMIFANGLFSKSAAQDTTIKTIIDEAYTFTELDQKTDEIEPIVVEVPPVPIVESIKFLEAVIVDDHLISETEMMLTQQELTEITAVIAPVTHAGNTDGPGMLITEVEVITAAVVPVDKILDHVEQMPVYPGGDTELMAFLKNNLNYPVVDQEMGVQGTVTARFVVNKDGSVGDVEIIRSLSPSCDKEAIRVIKKMKDWIPGKQNGLPVRVYYTLPVRFRLSN
ncbi:cell envelope biogenesis protein TonB [Bacteroidia bacterium]|nr:cell envelope biogenesis protein TonB [Bacteroidia bacterium]